MKHLDIRSLRQKLEAGKIPKKAFILTQNTSRLVEISEPYFNILVGNARITNIPKNEIIKALYFETLRQESLESRDIEIQIETRHWDTKRKITIPARTR